MSQILCEKVVISEKIFKAGKDAIMDKIEVEQMIEEYADMVYRIAVIHCVGRKEDAEDVFQETFLALLRSKKSFRSTEHRKAWLIRVVLNQCKKKFHSNERCQLVEPQKINQMLEKDSSAEQSEDTGWLYETLCNMTERYRKVMELYYIEEVATKEIAHILHISEGTVRKRLQRGREILRQLKE